MADIQKLNVNSTTYDISVPWGKVTGKPSTFAPSSHSHESILPTRHDSGAPAPNSTYGLTFQFSYNIGLGDWWNVLNMRSYSDYNYTSAQIATPAGNPSSDTGYSGNMYWRQGRNSTWSNWKTIVDSSNISSYALTSLPSHTHTKSQITDFPTIPTNTNQLTNGAGFITGITKSMVTTALGYTPPTSDTNTWRPITDSYSGTASDTSLSQKGGKAIYDALVNGYAGSAGSVPWSGVTGKPSAFPATRKILEINPSGTAVGWYRCIYINSSNASYAQTLIVSIQTSYYSPQNEHYIFAITCGYNGDIDINQLAGVRGGSLVNKIRVVWNNSGVCYFDFYKNSSGVESYRNSFRIEILSGDGTLQDGSIVSSAGGNVVEFTPIKGVKSLNGFYNNSGTSVSYEGHTHSQYITGITKSMVTTALGYTPPTSDTNTWRPVTNTYTGTDTSTCVSQKGTNDLYNALVNGYASSAGSVPWTGVTGKPTIFTANGQTGSDCNSIKTNGSYYVSPSSANSPGAYGEMLCMSNVDTHAQIYVPYSNGAMKFRGANNANGYYSWRTVIDDNNISSYALTSLPSHTHSYLPLSGGTLTGLLSVNTNGTTATYGAQNSSWVHFENTAGLNYYFSNSIHVNGDIKVYNKSWGITSGGRFDGSGFYQSSDERLKTFHDPIKVDLDKLKKLRKNYFKFNDNDELQIGVSAQEVREIYPEIVSENGDGYLSVAYDKLSVIALAALDEQQKEIDDLKDQLSTIKNILKEKGIL